MVKLHTVKLHKLNGQTSHNETAQIARFISITNFEILAAYNTPELVENRT